MRWPQITMIVIFAMGLGISMVQHGKPQPPTNFWVRLLATAIDLGILIAGGFFG